jgi:2-polyprenyl-3-methyl-5-hydroxy-6-metoxy-1,4-benzoquinol methylase
VGQKVGIKYRAVSSNNQSCYLCGSSDFISRPGTVRDCPEMEILECQNCGLVFLSSTAHIDDAFYESSKMHVDPVDITHWFHETHQDDERRFHDLERQMENKDVLDFGCGNGGFLCLARKVARGIAGVELDRSVAAHFKKERILLWHSIEDIKGKFDIITLFHVLEHLPDPVGYLRRLAGHLSEDGKIFVEVPNSNDALLGLYKCEAFAQFTYWSCHLFLFNPSTLARLVEKTDLTVCYIKQIQRYSLSNHLYWLTNGKPGGHQKWSFLDSVDLNSSYEKQLASIGMCDTLIACLEM